MPTKETLKEDPQTSQTHGEAKPGRERSRILFPYSDLDDAVGAAKGVHTVGGTSCQLEQLAAHLNQPASGSALQLRLNTARIFGLIAHSQGAVNLTPMGIRLCDSQQEKAARAEAFLAVPLYKAIYEKFKGVTLPAPGGLETTIVGLGVAPKQKETARRVFQRSAQQAGFFAYGNDRLVYPPIKGVSEPPLSTEDRTEAGDRGKNGNGGAGGGSGHHPFIEGLIRTLPKPESAWPIEARKKWLQAAAHLFDLIYADDTTGNRIEIKIQKDAEQ